MAGTNGYEHGYERKWDSLMAKQATGTLTDFLLARIAEDEENAGRYVDIFPDGDMAPLFRRVLAECEAQRRIIGRLRWAPDNPHWEDDWQIRAHWYDANESLADLATIYADHPDYREEWKP